MRRKRPPQHPDELFDKRSRSKRNPPTWTTKKTLRRLAQEMMAALTPMATRTSLAARNGATTRGAKPSLPSAIANQPRH